MGREARARVVAERVVRFEDVRIYEAVHDVLATFQPGRDRARIAQSAYDKLATIGKDRGERHMRMAMLTLDEDVDPAVAFTVAERDLVLEAMRAWNPPTIGLRLQATTVELLENAPEAAGPTSA